MKIKSLIQGTPEWHRHRATSRNASDASAVMGCSPYKTRAQLLDERATGIVPEVDAATQKRFDRGHAIEEAARPVAETMIGDDLYPIIGTDDDGYLSASFDGLTMDGKTAWECKTFNAGKAEEVAIGDIPEADFWQCVQQLYVSGAERLYYTLSDGTEEGSVHCHLTRDRAADFFDDLLAGWKQFDEDLANHKPRQVETAIVGAAPESLPAIHIELTGMVTASNLAEVREQALSVFRSINRDLQTDEDFANAEKTVKWCGEIEKKLDAAKEHALAQTASISELFSTLDQIKAEARETRLARRSPRSDPAVAVPAAGGSDGQILRSHHLGCRFHRAHPAFAFRWRQSRWCSGPGHPAPAICGYGSSLRCRPCCPSSGIHRRSRRAC